MILKANRDGEIEKLMQKAQGFEVFMRGNIPNTSSEGVSRNDVSTDTTDLNEEISQKNSRFAESKLRDEMAKIFASEMRSIEKNFRDEIEKLRNRICSMHEDLMENSQELSVKNEQLNLLKFTILEEREEAERKMKQKDEDIKTVIEKYHSEYENSQHKVEVLMNQLRESKKMIEEERLSIQNLKKQIKEERAVLAKREVEMMNNYKKLENDSKKLVKELNEKYSSAKRTAMNYKQYSEDKENHYRNEYERTKTACTQALEMAQAELNAALKQKEKSLKEQLKKIESEYEFKIDILKGMLKQQ